MKVVIASDHGGYQLKEELKAYIAQLGHEVADYGTHSTDSVDYPDFAFLVAEAVAAGAADRGIMIDGIGSASGIVANKVPFGLLSARHVQRGHEPAQRRQHADPWSAGYRGRVGAGDRASVALYRVRGRKAHAQGIQDSRL